MREETKCISELFVQNSNDLKHIMRYSNSAMRLCCAWIYTSKDIAAQESMYMESKAALKKHFSAFSAIRGVAAESIIATASIMPSPTETMEELDGVYKLLKSKKFYSSDYLPMAAMTLVQYCPKYDLDRIATRAREIYLAMKDAHPFLTSTDDYADSVLMALSEKEIPELMRRAQEGFDLLREEFGCTGVTQAMSDFLALSEGDVKENCRKTIQLCKLLKEKKCRFQKDKSLTVPASVAAVTEGYDIIGAAEEICEIDTWLSTQKGFGVWSVGSPMRRMFAGAIYLKAVNGNTDGTQNAIVGNVISTIVAEQAALMACIAATSAAAAANNS